MRLGLCSALVLSLSAPLAAQSPDLATVLANGYRFAYQEHGHGPPVVLVHGPLSDLRFWSPSITSLPDSIRAIAYSRRYAWPNPWRPDDPPYGLAGEANDLLALIRALRLERPILAGQDAGATISLLAALREPQAIGGLLLVEPPLDALLDDPLLRQQWASPDSEAWVSARLAGSVERPVPAVRALVERRDGPGSWDRAAPVERQAMEDNAQTVYLTVPSEPAIRCDTLATLSVPVVLVQGGSTPVRFQRILDALADCLHEAARDTIPGAGHAAPLTQPFEFGAHLAAWSRNRRP
jgi:pimeloyl-ACP methyl ester carboxylesterase